MTIRETPTETAAERYARHADESKRLLVAIRAAIDADAAQIDKRERETDRPADWADVGSMAEVARKLAEVADFLGAK